MNDREQKTLTFLTALSDAYKDEDNRDLNCISPIELPENGDMSEDIFCMLKAIHAIIVKIEGDEKMDMLDTIAMLNRLVFRFGKKEDESEDKRNDTKRSNKNY